MKKIFTIIMLVVCSVTIFTGCNKKLTSYTQISYEELVEKKNNGDDIPLVIGSSTCSACAVYKVIMEQFIEKYQVEVFYIDIDELSDLEYGKLKSEINFGGTPTTVFYDDGKITSYYNRVDGAGEIDDIVEIFTKNEYIK